MSLRILPSALMVVCWLLTPLCGFANDMQCKSESLCQAGIRCEGSDDCKEIGRIRGETKLADLPFTLGDPLPVNSERLFPDAVFALWLTDVGRFYTDGNNPVIQPPAKGESIHLPALYDENGKAEVSEEAIRTLRDIIAALKPRQRLKIYVQAYYSDTVVLTVIEQARYGKSGNLAEMQAKAVADYLRQELKLTEDSINYGVKDSDLPQHTDTTGKHYLEINAWYETLTAEKENLPIDSEVKRIKVCRAHRRCIYQRRSGGVPKIQLKYALDPISYEGTQVLLNPAFVQQLRKLLDDYGGRSGLLLKFIAHADNQKLPEALSGRYEDKKTMTQDLAEQVMRQAQQVLGLPNRALLAAGKGDEYPLASNDTASGRALNRRVEVEIWFDDPDKEKWQRPQICPGDEGADTVNAVYDERVIVPFKEGQPVYAKDFINRVKSILEKLADKANVRINFIGHTENERLSRRAAMVYGDHIGLSESRAHRVLEYTQSALNLPDKTLIHEGRGFTEPYIKDEHSPFARKNFLLPGNTSTAISDKTDARVELEFLYDEAAIVRQDPDVEVIPVIQEEPPISPYLLQPLRISVDGKSVDDTRMHSADIQRCTDVALSQAELRLNYDNLKKPLRLNIHATPSTVSYIDVPETEYKENVVIFNAYSNYRTYISRAEVRLFKLEQSLQSEPQAVVQLDADLQGEWWWIPEMDTHAGPVQELKYLLRVYDREGRFDETAPKRLWLVHQRSLTEEVISSDYNNAEQLAGYGESLLSTRNIPVNGGTVTVSGYSIPVGHRVWFVDQEVPIDYTDTQEGGSGIFVAEQIIPEGLNTVEVAVLDSSGNGELYLRDFRFKESDWFYVGMADLTLGFDKTNGPARLVTQDETHYNNDSFADGRLAFYTKGKTRSNVLITASADTLEEPIEDLFSNFMDKNPDAVFRRLDPDYFYPTYGDDSTIIEDAPTKGKFYIKAEKDKSFAMWGNFETKLYDTDLAQIDRSLYGADLHYQSLTTTKYGENRHQLDLFAAEPGTIQQRDEFRGTGGSLYFLRRRDITVGSDRLRVEIRDKDSGLVLQSRNLVPNQDYDIDYIQGRILLNSPLSSTTDDGLLVFSGSLSGHPVFLVVRYEYTPGFDELEDVAVGTRLSKWFGEYLKLGATYSNQEQIGDEHELAALDLTIRKTPASYIRIESASSKGPGQNEIFSNDGGFQFDPITAAPLDPDEAAAAYRLEAAAKLSDLFVSVPGSMTVYAEERAAGFAAPGQYTGRDLSLQGGSMNMPLGRKADLYLKFDARAQTYGLETQAAEIDTRYNYSDHWRFSGGLRKDRRKDRSLITPLTQTEGDRTDLAVEAHYDSRASWSAYGFVQNTLSVSESRENNDRLGTGGRYKISDRWRLDAEVSDGDGGRGARIGTDYLATDSTNIYLAYLLEPERDDTGLRARNGRSIAGFRTRYSDSLSVYGEERYTFGDIPAGLTHAYGVDLAPSDKWILGFTVESGTLEDPQTSAKTERNAYGFQGSYGSEYLQYATAIEYRKDINSTQQRETTLFKNSLNYKTSDNWRIIGKLNISESQSSQGEFFDGNFKEIVMGYAYRPTLNDRLNAIVKYTYFENLPSPDQLSAHNNSTAGLNQLSHIYSFDINYDWNPRLSIGGKYALRIGEVAIDRLNPVFFASNASLMILRSDWHLIKYWDVLAEFRHLAVEAAEDARSGLLVGVYRHLGDNIKLGIGYNFTDFSDDLTDLDYDSQGLFINVIGKL